MIRLLKTIGTGLGACIATYLAFTTVILWMMAFDADVSSLNFVRRMVDGAALGSMILVVPWMWRRAGSPD